MNRLKALLITALAANAGLMQAHASTDSTRQAPAHKWCVGGMAEAHSRFRPGERTTLGIPRFAVGAKYRPTKRWTLTGEIEFTTENSDKPYSLELIAAYEACPALQIQAGYLPVPVGLFNRDDCPVNRFAVAEPEGETSILPSGWTEGGAAICGEFGKGLASFSYTAMAILPLYTPKHGAESAYAARLDWLGAENLRLGGSVYFQPDAVTETPNRSTVNRTYWSFDGEYNGRIILARACALGEHIGRSGLQSRTFGGETGLKLMEITGNKKLIGLTPFVRYEYYQAPEDAENGNFTRIHTSLATAGINLSPLPWLLVKADYSARFHHSRTEKCDHEVAIALVLTGDFWKK